MPFTLSIPARRIFAVTCVASLLHQPLARAAAPVSASASVAAAPVNEVHGLNGTNVAFMMAATCKPETWAKFATWAKKSGFLKLEGAPTFKFSSSKEGLKAEGSDTRVSYNVKKGLEITYKGVTSKAADPCAAVLATFGKPPATKSALFKSILPSARAEEKLYQEEGKDADFGNALTIGALATAAMVGAVAVAGSPILVPGLAVSMLAAGTFGLYMSYTNAVSANSKQAFDEIMNSILTVQCNSAGMFVKTSSYRVSIRKVPPPTRMDVYDINSGATSHFINTYYAKKSREILLSLAGRCNNAQDAEKIMKQYADLRDRAAAKVTAAEEGRPVPGSEVEIEKDNAKTAPSRAPQNEEDDEDDDE